MNPNHTLRRPPPPVSLPPSMPDLARRHPRWMTVGLLTLALLGASIHETAAQSVATTVMAGSSPPPNHEAPASAPVKVDTPNLTPAREMPLLRPPSGEFATSPYGLQAIWAQGDLVGRATLLILLLMSIASWYVLARKLIEQARLRREAMAAGQNLSGVSSLDEVSGRLEAGSPFRFIVDSAASSLQQHAVVEEQVDLNTWLTQNIERSVATVQSRGQDGLAVLATVGATAPFVGLFGTVWGIYHALVKIGASGQASIDRVAGPVCEALIMTALGLAVAVPAVLAYNWLVRRNRLAMEDVRNFGSELHTRTLVIASRAPRARPEV